MNKFTIEQENYLKRVIVDCALGKVKLTTYQTNAINRVFKKREYNSLDKGVLNSIKYTYKYFLEKGTNERVKI